MKVRILASFAGEIGGHDSPSPGSVVDVPDALGKALCSDGRAEEVEAPKRKAKIETATAKPAENAATRTKKED